MTCLDCKYCTKTHDGYMNDGMFYISCEQGKNWITPNAANYCNDYDPKSKKDRIIK